MSKNAESGTMIIGFNKKKVREKDRSEKYFRLHSSLNSLLVMKVT